MYCRGGGPTIPTDALPAWGYNSHSKGVPPMVNPKLTQCDISIVCALSEEVEAAIHCIEDAYGVQFHEGTSRRKSPYRFTTIRRARGGKATVQVSWAREKGPVEMALHLFPILMEFKPRWAFMTGICAGDRKALNMHSNGASMTTISAPSNL